MAQFNKLKIKGVGEWEVGGGGSGGTTNYNSLTNKPKINNVELTGNKTASQLGLAVPGDIPTDTHINDLIDAKITPLEDLADQILEVL